MKYSNLLCSLVAIHNVGDFSSMVIVLHNTVAGPQSRVTIYYSLRLPDSNLCDRITSRLWDFCDSISIRLPPHLGQILVKFRLGNNMTIDHLPLRVILGKVCTQGRLEGEFCYARLGAAKKNINLWY